MQDKGGGVYKGFGFWGLGRWNFRETSFKKGGWVHAHVSKSLDVYRFKLHHGDATNNSVAQCCTIAPLCMQVSDVCTECTVAVEPCFKKATGAADQAMPMLCRISVNDDECAS